MGLADMMLLEDLGVEALLSYNNVERVPATKMRTKRLVEMEQHAQGSSAIIVANLVITPIIVLRIKVHNNKGNKGAVGEVSSVHS